MRVGVVGAGLTGLATVHELARHQIDTVCFEARTDVGGVIQSSTIDGITVEHGPQRMRRSEIVDEYLEAFDLSDSLREAPASYPIYIYRDGRLREVPFDVGTGLRTDLLSLRGKLRLLKEPLTDGAKPGESAGAYFERKLGSEAYSNVIEPLFGGLYASDPKEMPATVALEPLLKLENDLGSLTRVALRRIRSSGDRPPAIIPDSGMAALPKAIAETYRDTIQTASPVVGLSPDKDGYVLHTDNGETIVDRVVIATPAAQAGHLLSEVDAASGDRLNSLNYNPLALVYLRADIDDRALGFQVSREEDFTTLGVAYNGVAFGRDNLLTAFIGGMHEPGLVDRSDEKLCSVVTQDLRDMLGVDPTCIGVHRVDPGMPAYDGSWELLESVSTPNDIYLVGNYTSRVGIPGRIRQAKRVAADITDRTGE